MNLVIEAKTAEEFSIWTRIIEIVTTENITKATAAWLKDKKSKNEYVTIHEVLNFLEAEIHK